MIMGLFNRKKKKLAETNEINNKSLKEGLANIALQTLIEGEDYAELANTICQFGYLFLVEERGVEALFKITTDKGTFYFATQKGKVMQLNINEELFKSITETTLSMHQ